MAATDKTPVAPKQVPTKNRIVDFFVEDRANPGMVVSRPGIIVAVHSDTCVNLQVFTDGENDGLNNVVHKTSVDEGTLAGQWMWPSKI